MNQTDHLFIVGAGFSNYAGLPLTSDFTEKLLDVTDFKEEGPSVFTVKFLRQFVQDTFDHKPEAAAKVWPHLEDIFTCIDLSANSGHHLGTKYSPSDLRSVRRALIVRIIRMLRRTYTNGKKSRTDEWRTLERFFEMFEPEKSAFLCMNWDTVIEEGMFARNVKTINYACDARFVEFADSTLELAVPSTPSTVQVLKVHGSANWLYCDSCRTTYWVDPIETLRVADQLFRDTDWQVVEKHINEPYRGTRRWRARKCPLCKAKALGTRFATFSYRKALDFPMYEQTWSAVEHLLREAQTWIFIGYSLPAADYEFKHLLKRVQLSRTSAPKLVLITGGDVDRSSETQRNYQKFFGPKLGRSSSAFFGNGLNENAIEYLKSLGALISHEPARARRASDVK